MKKHNNLANFLKENKWTSAGGVVIDIIGGELKILLVQPTNFFGGYEWTFPKGRIEPNETRLAAAKREVQEETGYGVKVLPNSYLGAGEGDMSITHYYVMEPTGETGTKDKEMAQVRFFTFEEAEKLLSGSARDISILKKAKQWLNKTNYL